MTVTLHVEDGLYEVKKIEDKEGYYRVEHTKGGHWASEDYDLKEKLEKAAIIILKIIS